MRKLNALSSSRVKHSMAYLNISSDACWLLMRSERTCTCSLESVGQKWLSAERRLSFEMSADWHKRSMSLREATASPLKTTSSATATAMGAEFA